MGSDSGARAVLSSLMVALLSLATTNRLDEHHRYEPTGSVQGIFTADDYPPAALDHNEQGTVGVLVRVNKKGEVSDCVVEESSGFASLDAQTCRIVWLRAKFKPAHDRRGRPVTSEKHDRITWRIAETEGSSPRSLSGSLAGLISSDDYPPQALDRNEEGTVGVVLRIDDKGTVGKCTIESSSGSDVLDAQTCRVLSLRAKFEPARDRLGNPVPSEYHSRIVWRIGPTWWPSEPWSTRFVLKLGPGGRQLSCRYEADGAMSPAPGEKPIPCPPASEMPLPAFADLPSPTAAIVFEERFGLAANPKPPLSNGALLFARQVLSLEISATGKVISCKTIERSGDAPWLDPCADFAAETFRPRQGSDGHNVPFAATIAYNLYVYSVKLAKLDQPGAVNRSSMHG